MGLDAVVYCDCWERGATRVPPKTNWQVAIDDQSGCRLRAKGSDASQVDFDNWDHNACEHEDGILLHHRLGNIGLVGFLREILERRADEFSFVLARVLFSGTHAGDAISVAELPLLEAELSALSDMHGDSLDDEDDIRRFEHQMWELLRTAKGVKKPISF